MLIGERYPSVRQMRKAPPFLSGRWHSEHEGGADSRMGERNARSACHPCYPETQPYTLYTPAPGSDGRTCVQQVRPSHIMAPV